MARIAFICVALLAITRAFLYHSGSFLGTYRSTLARADALLIGCGFALLPASVQMKFWNGRKGHLVAWSCAATLLVFTFRINNEADFLYLGGFTFIAAYAATMIVHVVFTPHGLMARALSKAWLVQIGKRAYGIYVYHMPVFMAFDVLCQRGMNFAAATILKLISTAVISWLSYKYLETPFLRRNSQSREIRVNPETCAEESTPTAVCCVEYPYVGS